MITLKHKVSVTIPTQLGESATHTTSFALAKAQAELTRKFGGSTTVQGEGTWENERGSITTEKVHIVTAWYAEEGTGAAQWADTFAQWLLHALDQEAVAVEIGGALHIISR